MTVDLDRRLSDLRRAPHWPTDERAAILDQVLAADPTPHRTDLRLTSPRPDRRRRAFTLATVAGLAAAACIAVPALLPSGSPGAAQRAEAAQALHHLSHLAAITAISPSDHLGPNQYVHLVDVGHQSALSGQPTVESRFEYWIRTDGLTWQRRDVRFGDGTPAQKEVWLLPRGESDPEYPAPQYLGQLPTEPAALDSYLRAHTAGSTSADERVFVAVGTIVGRGLATAKLRAAAIEVLARLGHIRLGDHTRDSSGNPVQEFEFVDPANRPGEIQAVLFDTRTAQITEQRDYLHGQLHFRSTVPLFEVVDSVPADVRQKGVQK